MYIFRLTQNFQVIHILICLLHMIVEILTSLRQNEKFLNLKSKDVQRAFMINILFLRILLILRLCSYHLKAYMLRLLIWAWLRFCKKNIKSILRDLLQWLLCSIACKWASEPLLYRKRAVKYGRYLKEQRKNLITLRKFLIRQENA